ncbi:MAG: hypothetical protein KDA44_20815 [Planctomycetales bacterium]|nr:hypothetical protein [Planctomycetales bacterium]
MLVALSPVARAADASIRVHADQLGAPLSPHLYGLFFEDINFGADGGLYAELLQNRSFEYFPCIGWNPRSEKYHALYAWEKVERGGGRGAMRVERGIPLNRNNTNYLSLHVDEPGDGVGVRNLGFDGIRVDAGAKYRMTFYARWERNARGTATVALETPDGEVLARRELPVTGNQWRKYVVELTADADADDAQLVLTIDQRGTLCLDMISLFPLDTYGGRENGLRADLVQALKDLNPKFLRFPGGCIAHGHSLQNAYRWKDTVGDVSQRRPNWNRWGYHQTYGLGYYEYFLLCEDIGATALPVLPVGVSCGFNEPYQCVPIGELQPWIDDALDLIEFANGPVDSEWGALRAEMGHPEPFNLQFICLGNEEHDTPELHERFPHFVKAVREAHPEIKIIGTSGLGDGVPLYPLMRQQRVYSSDEHYYESPEWYVQHQDRFDSFPRGGPLVFVGEYASRGIQLQNAVAEAAYLTGIERNGDLVDMACYAPLFAHVDHTQWTAANLIYFDKRRVVKTPNYYVQQLFGRNKGDVAVEYELEQADQSQGPLPAAAVGVGTWLTAASFDKATVNDQPLANDQWQSRLGNFQIEDGVYRQTDQGADPAMATSSTTFDGDKTVIRLRFKKDDGREGALVVFDYQDEDNYLWWNIGGWGNTFHGIERRSGGAASTLVRRPGRVETGRWYDVRVERTPGRIRCFLDDRLVHDYADVPPGLNVAAARDTEAGQVILKLINPTNRDLDAAVELTGVDSVGSTARAIVLAGAPQAVNTITAPNAIEPVESTISVGREFECRVPASSVQVIRIDVDAAK